MNIKLLPTLVMIFSFGAAPATWAAEPMGKMIVVDPEIAQFTTPAGMPDCAKLTVLSGDPEKGPSVVLAKMSSGCTIPWHWHTPTENVMLVSGNGKLEMKGGKPFPFQPGAYLSLPSHHIHQARCVTDCKMFISSDAAFDIHYVNKKGKEIPATEALK